MCCLSVDLVLHNDRSGSDAFLLSLAAGKINTEPHVTLYHFAAAEQHELRLFTLNRLILGLWVGLLVLRLQLFGLVEEWLQISDASPPVTGRPLAM